MGVVKAESWILRGGLLGFRVPPSVYTVSRPCATASDVGSGSGEVGLHNKSVA